MTCLWFGSPPDEDVRRYCERLNRDPEPPVQVNQVDSCFHRTIERVGLTLYDDPEGQYCTKKSVFSSKGAESCFGSNSTTVMTLIIATND